MLRAHDGSAIGNQRGFSLVEVLVVVVMLSVIILGLVAMFGQTERAFRTGMTQVDVLESGRMATDLITRELEQLTPSDLPAGSQSGSVPFVQPNFYVVRQDYPPLILALPGSGNSRTNLLDDLFFIYRRNREWVGVGYFVREYDPMTGNVIRPVVGSSPPKSGVGVLYRYETSAYPLTQRGPVDLFAEFYRVAYANRWVGNNLPPARIIDGVLNFKFHAYDTNGVLLTRDLPQKVPYSKSWISMGTGNTPPGVVDRYMFFSNAVPASVEMELGILEDRAWDRYRSLPDSNGRYRYLTNQIGRVHVFRERIPIRNVDPVAYR